MIKNLIKEYRRRRILKDIKAAKLYYQEGGTVFMCYAFMRVNTKYHKKPIDSIIPEFNQEFLDAKYKGSTVWWDLFDRKSRIKAFDKLIEVYS